jgi:hypothetical protein
MKLKRQKRVSDTPRSSVRAPFTLEEACVGHTALIGAGPVDVRSAKLSFIYYVTARIATRRVRSGRESAIWLILAWPLAASEYRKARRQQPIPEAIPVLLVLLLLVLVVLTRVVVNVRVDK